MTDSESGRDTQNIMHPLSMINWEPHEDTVELPEDDGVTRNFDKFQKLVVARRSHAFHVWYKIKKHVPPVMQNAIRSMWEIYWKNLAMGPEAFEMVMTLVRRKLGIPFNEEALHKLQEGDESPDSDEPQESPVREVLEDGEAGSGTEELGEVNENA
jgi:hypothetical protein